MPAPVLPRRLEATEGRPSREILRELKKAGVPRDTAVAELTRASARLRRTLRFGEDRTPISVDADAGRVTISNLAGVIRLGRRIELDLAPKFIGHTHAGWREDFLAIANVTGEGQILAGASVTATYGEATDLASLIGRVFVEQFRANQRYPLHVYRRRRWRDFSLDGDVDLDEIPVVIDEDGVPQVATVLDRRNPYNALLRAAARALTAEVSDPGTRSELSRIVNSLPQQAAPPDYLPPVPARDLHWQPLIDLAQRVLQGFDVRLESDILGAPGFLVRTWQAWERLLFVALRSAIGVAPVMYQEPFVFGQRVGAGGKTTNVHVYPDVTVRSGEPPLSLFDAKYKAAPDKGPVRLSGGDLQEANAFMDASGASSIVLLYPRAADAASSIGELGEARVIDRVELSNGRRVVGADVEVRGIGKRGGFRAFATRLRGDLSALEPAP